MTIELAKTYNGIKADRVYYDPKFNAFFQVKIKHCKSVVIGGFCDFYTDAQSCIGRYSMPKGYLKNCIPVPDASLFNKSYPLQNTFHVSGDMDYSWYKSFRELKKQTHLTDTNGDLPDYGDPYDDPEEYAYYDSFYDMDINIKNTGG